MTRRRYELTDHEWSILSPLLPNKLRGVPRVDDRRMLNGILWRFRTGSPWAELPERYGPPATCYNRFVRWRKAGVWDRLLEAVSKAYDGEIVMIDSTCVRVHQACGHGKKGMEMMEAWDVPAAGLRAKSTRSSTPKGQRNLVERFFNRIKQFRGIATRYDKRPENYFAAVKLIATRIWCPSL